jgi:ABC-2 type transport system ATP-binding protein
MSIPPTTNQVQGPVIHVQGLEKSYKKLRVLRGVDLDVPQGSIFALLGSNGAGKSRRLPPRGACAATIQ